MKKMMISGTVAAVLAVSTLTTPAAAAEVSPVFGKAAVKTMSANEAKGITAKGYWGNYYAYYGMYDAYYSYLYSNYGLYSTTTNSSTQVAYYYYSYLYAASAATNLYYAYYYSYYGY